MVTQDCGRILGNMETVPQHSNATSGPLIPPSFARTTQKLASIYAKRSNLIRGAFTQEEWLVVTVEARSINDVHTV